MIKENLTQIRKTIKATAQSCGRNPDEIRLVAVSKRFPVDHIREAMNADQMLFGENYLQEAQQKISALGAGPHFHFIGHLQSNKAKVAAGIFQMIETIDRIKLATTLERHLASLGRTMDGLIQINIGREPQKSGVLPEECSKLLEQLQSLNHLKIKGLMCIPPHSDDPELSRPHFQAMRELAYHLQRHKLLPQDRAPELSMGMSDDYLVAIEEGATLIRIGTSIFGERPR
ncbi:MAG: YggS family pyridoxal phosphate-dependent enzyme [Desulfobulbaceae bacterium]|uniref:Pyridoxal phosphate homeostasis protein n=1 Tax=Candidatus Desulfatifera sulfidica TaxID=2841691 RepID=A0A8J6N7B7_9BACT|nr:YggS family pyridoxal phosphate-dependent enzyme [Candidatus Desulfatifera sulfidica]